MRKPFLLLALLILGLSPPPAPAQSRPTAQASFRQLYGEVFRIESGLGSVEVFLDPDGATQVCGTLNQDQTTFSSVDSEGADPERHIYLEDRGVESSQGRPVLSFRNRQLGVQLRVVNHLGVEGIPESVQAFWKLAVPGSIVEEDGQRSLLTAVLLVTSAGETVVAAFPEKVPLRI